MFLLDEREEGLRSTADKLQLIIMGQISKSLRADFGQNKEKK